MAAPAPRESAVRKTHKLFIGGAFVRSESGRSMRNPAAPGVNLPRASRKDLREAVSAARKAQPDWAGRTAMNRGQILYRLGEMLDARRGEFMALLGGGRPAGREVDDAVEALVWYAGWTDKLAHVTGTVNPVAGPFFTFTLPEPTGVVGLVAPGQRPLSGLVSRIAAAICSGNTVVALLAEDQPLPGLTLGEVVATSDVPAGTINLLSGQHDELLPWLAAHMDVNALDIAGCDPGQSEIAERAAADNVKRVTRSRDGLTLEAVTGLLEFKTVWHPIGR
jgi:acyl-CoA reductase-like NAD-dependent aldehyde dehydrogenase